MPTDRRPWAEGPWDEPGHDIATARVVPMEPPRGAAFERFSNELRIAAFSGSSTFNSNCAPTGSRLVE